MLNACVSVLMPCRNAAAFLDEAVSSVLKQSVCIELLVADGGSSDDSLEILEALSRKDSRVRIVSRHDVGPADALNKALKEAKGTFIGWLNADDLYPCGALERAVDALNKHPEWLMAYGEGEEFNSATGLQYRYPTLPPSVGIEGFLSHCFICQPTVVLRRSMAVLLGPFDPNWKTSFDFDYWLRAFTAFPTRIGYIPHLQGRTRLHDNTITSQQRLLVALEATQLLARHFNYADGLRIHNYALEVQHGLAQPPKDETINAHLQKVLRLATPYLSTNAIQEFELNWLSSHNPKPQLHHKINIENHISPSSKLLPPFEDRPFGVNLIGHAFEAFGIGEDIRMAARALQSVGVPCCVIYHPASNGTVCSERELEPLLCTDPSGGPYAFNLVCMAAPIQARWLQKIGLDPLRERYTISYWPWETQQWPDEWMSLFDFTDELWSSSKFTAVALEEPASKKRLPLHVMPMSVEINKPERFCSISSRNSVRRRYGINLNNIVFGYGFDFNSTAARKNPMSVIDVFQRAFPLPSLPSMYGVDCNTHPLSDQVSLVIKTFAPKASNAEWNWLQQRVAEDQRIILVSDTLSRDDLLALYASYDVFLSLHRSEGFGRGLAEALQLGVDVIATDFGGNTDFCVGPLAHLIRCKLVPIARGHYPCADDHIWAEPDLDHAIDLCQQIALQRSSFATNHEYLVGFNKSPSLSRYRDQFSARCVGDRYLSRLKKLWAGRSELNLNTYEP